MLKGLKENVIIGRLITAGTGVEANRSMIVVNQEEEKNKEQAVNEAESLHSEDLKLEADSVIE